jgi:hypothetical protein
MKIGSATTTALGAALALAVTLTTAVAPAFAETPTIDVTPSNPTIQYDLGPLPEPQPEPQPESSAVMFQPDVRVNYLGKSASGGKVTYRFRVQNIGIDTATDVGLGNEISQHSNSGSVATLQSGSSGTIASLATDQSKDVNVVCTPLPGYHCDGASLQAYLNNDLDPSNNRAHSH